MNCVKFISSKNLVNIVKEIKPKKCIASITYKYIGRTGLNVK